MEEQIIRVAEYFMTEARNRNQELSFGDALQAAALAFQARSLEGLDKKMQRIRFAVEEMGRKMGES
ncbi:MAG: hypothetical protein WA952_07380 [Lewinella sp.]